MQGKNQRQQEKNETMRSRPHQHHHQKKLYIKEAPPLNRSQKCRTGSQHQLRNLYPTDTRQTNCMTRMISRDYHFRYHSAYYIVYHRFLPKTYTKLFSIKGCCFCCCCFCCCCFQCNFLYLIVGIRAWSAG
jgi:hypothetical protein